MEKQHRPQTISTKRFTDLILDIGTYLLASGAHCGRINSNISRIAKTWGFEVNMQPSFKGLLVSVNNINQPSDTITLFREAPTHKVHLWVLTAVSRLSWKVVENGLTIDETEKEFERIKNKPSYNLWVSSLAAGVACGGLCAILLGDIYNVGITFLAAFLGSLLRFKIGEMKFNPMIAIILAAFVTTMITGLGSLHSIGVNPEAAIATGVLYLIPGVPLINSMIDLIEGYLSSAINRALFSGFILLCIAVGMTLSITLMGINNFN